MKNLQGTDLTARSRCPTAADLLRIAVARRRGAPPLLVLTILIQLLKKLRDLHNEGRAHGALTPECLTFPERRATTLFDDPYCDFELVVVGGSPTEEDDLSVDPARDLYSAGAVALVLLTGRSQLRKLRRRKLGAFAPLLEGLLASRPENRWALAEALTEARRLAHAILEEQDQRLSEERGRRESDLRRGLSRALGRSRVRDAAWLEKQLRAFLGARATGDGDLLVARTWLEEEAARATKRNETVKVSRRKLALTALPLLFALLLTLLLAILFRCQAHSKSFSSNYLSSADAPGTNDGVGSMTP